MKQMKMASSLLACLGVLVALFGAVSALDNGIAWDAVLLDTTFGNVGHIYTVVVGDFDQDGYDDVAYNGNTDFSIQIGYSNGDETFEKKYASSSVNTYIGSARLSTSTEIFTRILYVKRLITTTFGYGPTLRTATALGRSILTAQELLVGSLSVSLTTPLEWTLLPLSLPLLWRTGRVAKITLFHSPTLPFHIPAQAVALS